MKLQETLETLFKEIFEGTAPGASGTWVVQGGEALEDTLSLLTADQASCRPTPQSSSIAAHVLHMTHYLQMTNSQARGQAFEPDWAQTWQKQTVSETEWDDAKVNLLSQKQLLQELMGFPGMVDMEDAVFGAIANIAHAAYHLGAIRQLFNTVRTSGSEVPA